ncbi:maleylpyruvate isomerase family mycothiol-dependent enzyme [Spirillospora sp. CA-294931]|uniref:maleylpyruvate isomerase family mycothiol-dependent enzyme n=1 Tax=Spirillospora sp. CA-294931 TaxID=3240042 RepID=UPI003D8CB61D
MEFQQILSWTEAERLDLADFLDTLDEHEWGVDSLCAGWTVHDVLAHLTLSTRTGLPAFVKGVIRARGSLDRMEADAARRRAAEYTPAELIAQFRATAASPRRSPGSKPADPLVDVLVHGQDIARPLGRVREMPAERAAVALERVWTSGFYGARKRLPGTRLIATDTDWTAGEGAKEVRGPAGELLLLSTGRPADR